MRLDENQIKWLDKQCQKATEAYNKAEGFGALVQGNAMMSIYQLARLFYFQVDLATGKLYTEDKEKKTRTYVS